MRFLFVSNFLCESSSGSAGSVLQIAEALRERGHVVDLLWRADAWLRLPHTVTDTVALLPSRQFRQVRAHLEARPAYDVVMVSQPYAYKIYERLPRAFGNTLFLNRTHGWEERRHVALQAAGENPGSAHWSALSRLSQRVWAEYCARTALTAHGIVAPSSLCADFIVKTYRIPVGRVRVIPYGVDVENRNPEIKRATRTLEDPLRILFVGNYLPIKGSGLLEEALPRLASISNSVEVTFVVPDESVAQVRAIYAPAFGPRMTVLPWLPREQLFEIYGKHDVYLSPSLFEGFGKAAVEAMRLGLCVVGSDEGALHDIAGFERGALLFAAGDWRALLLRLKQCLHDRSLVRRIGEEGCERARELTWERTARLTEEWCSELRSRILPKPRRSDAVL